MRSDGKVVISTALDNGGLEKGIGNISGSLGGLKSVLGKLTGLIATAFSVRAIVQFGVASSKAAMDLSNALLGLQSIVEGQGRSFSKAKTFLEEYVKDGLIPMANAATAYKNLAARGYDDSQIQQTLVALKDASAFGRQASLSMGEAVQSATEGLKNENSILVDNAGVTKNVAKMWDEYAKSIGTTASKLTQQQKIQAEVTGILKESKYQTGDAAKVAGTLSGQLQQLSYNFNNLKVAIGNAINPIVQSLLPVVNSAVNALTRFANAIASVVGAIFGKVSVQTEQITETASAGAKAENALADGIKAAGKAAKKSLADFDQLNVLQSPDSGGGSGGAGSGGAPDAFSSTVTVDSEIQDEISPKIQAVIDGIRNFIAPLKEIDLSPLKESLGGLGESFTKFSEVVGDVFSWVWYNILVPLAEWFVEKAAPASVDALSAAFEGLSATVSVLFDAVKECWDELQPIFSWIGDTVLVILGDLKEIGQEVAKKWKENAPKLKKTFENIGTVIQDVWTIVGPILTWIRDALSEIAVAMPINDLQLIFDRLFAISEILAGLSSGDVGQIFNGFGAAVSAETEYAGAQIKTFASALGIDLDGIGLQVKETAENIGKWFSDCWSEVEATWEGVATWFNEKVIVPLQEFWAPIGAWFGELFGGIEQTFNDVFYNIGVIAEGCWETIKYAWDLASTWFDENVIQPVAGFFEGAWSDISTWATEAWADTKEAFQPVVDWFDKNIIQPVSEFFSDLWDGFSEEASEAWKSVKETFAGIGQWGKDILNELIEALNSGLSKIFSGINNALSKLRDLKVGDIQPFSGIKTIKVPQIPYLAKGAVLPPNKPFMAVVGDQRHGTNIEAPLATIQEAVAAVMADHTAGNMAGHEATVAVLREILEAVLGIQIGDDVIGNAVSRYNRKQAVMRGGTL